MTFFNDPKRYLLVTFLFLLFLLLPGAAGAGEETTGSFGQPYEICLEDGRITGNDSVDMLTGEYVCFFPLEEEDAYGCVLPGSWDLTALRIRLSGMDSIRIGSVEYWDGDSIIFPEGTAVEAVFFAENPITAFPPIKEVVTIGSGETAEVKVTSLGERKIELMVRQTGGLPVLFIETESGSSDAIHADKTVKEPGTLQMTDAEGNLLYQGSLSAIRTRGNATFSYSKKPYQIKLAERAALTGSRAGKTWILLANALDRSLIRNTMAFALARYSQAFTFTPDSQPVDLYLNHDYKGTYLLTEKVEISNHRLQIINLEKETENLNPDLDLGTLPAQGNLKFRTGGKKYYEIPEEPEDVTGGYLVQINAVMRYETEASGFITSQGGIFTSQEPKYLSEAQAEYISGVFQQIEDALFSEDGIDPASGKHFTELLDLASFVNEYLMGEVLDNFDAQYCYFYKDSDEVDPKVYAGPVWDQDNILGVWILQSNPSVIHLTEERDPFFRWLWFQQASRHQEFLEAAKADYLRIYHPGIMILLGRETDPSGNLRSIEEYADEVRLSAEMDYFRWTDPMGVNKERYNTETGDTFEEQVQFLTEYLETRLKALDAFFLPAEQ